MGDSHLESDVGKRRTFAIISHPDAGKTTITEKLLLLGNLIQVAGTVKGRKSEDTDDPRYYAFSKVDTITTDGLTLVMSMEQNTFI